MDLQRRINPTKKAVLPLALFQREVVEDAARFMLMVASRRVGKTFGFTNKISHDLRRSVMQEMRTAWRIISRTQDTAKEALAEVANHLRVWKAVEKARLEIQDEDTDLAIDGIRIKQFSIDLPHGVTCTAMTAHPDAMRGFGGHVFLDEHAYHRDSKELWKGAASAVLRGHRLFVTSTPHYQTGNFFELCRKADMVSGRPPAKRQNGIWSCHWVDVHMAAKQLFEIGLDLNLEEMRELAGDEETWRQEFCCEFLSAVEQWIPLELIAAARSPLACATWDFEREAEYEGQGRLYLGGDIGRKRDRTSLYLIRRVGDVNICRGIIALDRMPFEQQHAVISALLTHPQLHRACIDQTGMGLPLVERLQAGPHGHKVEGVQFTLETKEQMALLVRRRFEEKLDKIPENAPALERALAAVKREATASGNLRFDAARTEHGHADEFWGLALADLAADSPRVHVPASECGLGGDTVCADLASMEL